MKHGAGGHRLDEGGKAEKRRLERAGEEREKRGRASSRQNEFIKTATRLRLTSKETSFRGIVSRFPSLALRPSTIMRIHTRAVYTIEATRVSPVVRRKMAPPLGARWTKSARGRPRDSSPQAASCWGACARRAGANKSLSNCSMKKWSVVGWRRGMAPDKGASGETSSKNGLFRSSDPQYSLCLLIFTTIVTHMLYEEEEEEEEEEKKKEKEEGF